MKSEYRQIIESILSQEAKLVEVKRMHDEAVARVAKTAEWVRINEASLKKYEDRLAELQVTDPTGEHGRIDRLESEIDDLRKSFKVIAGWYLGGNQIRKDPPPQDGTPK